MSTDPFDLLGLEPRFELDLAALERRVRELNRSLHPDRYAGASAGERRQALGRSIDVNDAQRRLKDPLTRAEALLGRLAPGAPRREGKAEPALLLEMMELGEALAQAKRSRDLARGRAVAEPVKRREAALLRELHTLFEQALGGAPAQLDLLDARLTELRYVRRFLQELDAMEDELA